jgi:hypothetical protein
MRIALYVSGVVLGFGGLAILLLGLAYTAFALAWSSHRFVDLILIASILLYAVPAGVALLYSATWAVSSSNSEVYADTTAPSRRTIGGMLLLPALATVVLLVLGFPDYRFWLGSGTEGMLTVLLALLLAGAGVWLMTRAEAQSEA